MVKAKIDAPKISMRVYDTNDVKDTFTSEKSISKSQPNCDQFVRSIFILRKESLVESLCSVKLTAFAEETVDWMFGYSIRLTKQDKKNAAPRFVHPKRFTLSFGTEDSEVQSLNFTFSLNPTPSPDC